MHRTLFIALGVFCASSQGFALAADSLDVPRMVQRYEHSCPNFGENYSYQKFKEYAAERGEAKRNGTENEISDVTENLALRNSDFIKFEAKIPACALAMAENLIDGMTYYRVAKPKNAFGYSDTSGHLAIGYVWKWLIGPPEDRSTNLALADEAMRQYFAEYDDSFTPGQMAAYMFAAEGYRELTRYARTPADGMILLDKAIAFAEEGLKVARDKSEALFSARHVYSDKIRLLKEIGQDSTSTARRALRVLLPHMLEHGEVGVLIADLELQLGNTVAGVTQLGWVTQHEEAAHAFCASYVRGLTDYSYPAIDRYLKADPDRTNRYLDATCHRGGEILIPVRKSSAVVTTEPDVETIITDLENSCPNRQEIPEYDALVKVKPELQILRRKGPSGLGNYGTVLTRWFATREWSPQDKNCARVAAREALHILDYFLAPTPTADSVPNANYYLARADWRIKSIALGRSTDPRLDAERASDDYSIFLALRGGSMEVERSGALESIALKVAELSSEAAIDSNAALIATVGIQLVSEKLPQFKVGNETLVIFLENLLKARDSRTPPGTPQWREQLQNGIALMKPHDRWRYALTAYIVLSDIDPAKKVVADRIARNALTASDCNSGPLQARNPDIAGFRSREAAWFATVVDPYCKSLSK